MRAGIVIPARPNSLRLPKKHFADLGGKPLIARLLLRLGDALPITIATTPGYIEMREWAVQSHLGLFLDGAIDEQDVTARVYGAAWASMYDPVVIVQGDSPFIDGRMIKEALEFYKAYDVGLLWNTSPSGFRWRIVSQRLLKAASAPREHVLQNLITAWPFRAKEVTHWLSAVKLSVDTKEDLAFAKEVGEAVGWDAPADNVIAEAIRRRPDVRTGDAT